jgi:hypothetical protein
MTRGVGVIVETRGWERMCCVGDAWLGCDVSRWGSCEDAWLGNDVSCSGGSGLLGWGMMCRVGGKK